MHPYFLCVISAVSRPSGDVQGFLGRQVGAVRAVSGTSVTPCLPAELHAEVMQIPVMQASMQAEANNAQIVDPREYYQGSLKRTLKMYPHIGKTVPAMGYSAKQVPQSGKECPHKATCMLA